MLPAAEIVAVRVLDVLPDTVKVAPALALPIGKKTSVAAGPETDNGAASEPCTRIGLGSFAVDASQAPSALRSEQTSQPFIHAVAAGAPMQLVLVAVSRAQNSTRELRLTASLRAS